MPPHWTLHLLLRKACLSYTGQVWFSSTYTFCRDAPTEGGPFSKTSDILITKNMAARKVSANLVMNNSLFIPNIVTLPEFLSGF